MKIYLDVTPVFDTSYSVKSEIVDIEVLKTAASEVGYVSLAGNSIKNNVKFKEEIIPDSICGIHNLYRETVQYQHNEPDLDRVFSVTTEGDCYVVHRHTLALANVLSFSVCQTNKNDELFQLSGYYEFSKLTPKLLIECFVGNTLKSKSRITPAIKVRFPDLDIPVVYKLPMNLKPEDGDLGKYVDQLVSKILEINERNTSDRS